MANSFVFVKKESGDDPLSVFPQHPPYVTVKRKKERKMSTPWIGGPRSRLPFWLESLLSWILAISCLSVALYHYMRQTFVSKFLFLKSSSSTIFLIPLTTHSRKEILAVSTVERYQQFINYLNKEKDVSEWNDDDLVQLIRSNLLIRRLVSLLMIKQQKQPLSQSLDSLIQRLIQLWPRLLELPSASPSNNNSSKKYYKYEISIIIPAYREDGKNLLLKLQETHDLIDSNTSREQMEVIIVHSDCTNLQLLLERQQKKKKFLFGNMKFLPDQGGGRGPCLNQGAAVANGRILTFLHADTRLSPNWNLSILKAFSTTTNSTTTTTACAFSFAIDTTGLEKDNTLLNDNDNDDDDDKNNNNNNYYFPPGIKAVERTANWRSHWFYLPYGDQCLSIPEYVFTYLGGFPHQCLMEDYELIRLIRHRVVVVASSEQQQQQQKKKERLAILDLPAYCGVRRWQKFGVLYVTYFNSKLVNLYAKEDITAEGLYQLYYGIKPKGADSKTPWEVELESTLL